MMIKILLGIVIILGLYSQCTPRRFVYKYPRPVFMEENQMDSIFQIGIRKYMKIGLTKDTNNIFIKILRSEEGTFTFLVGSFNKVLPDIKRFARRTRRYVKVYNRLVPLLFYHDFYITSSKDKISSQISSIRGYMIQVNYRFEIISEGLLL